MVRTRSCMYNREFSNDCAVCYTSPATLYPSTPIRIAYVSLSAPPRVCRKSVQHSYRRDMLSRKLETGFPSTIGENATEPVTKRRRLIFEN